MNKTLLEWIEYNEEAEVLIREFDQDCNTCLICTYLFDTIETIEASLKVDLTNLKEKLIELK